MRLIEDDQRNLHPLARRCRLVSGIESADFLADFAINNHLGHKEEDVHLILLHFVEYRFLFMFLHAAIPFSCLEAERLRGVTLVVDKGEEWLEDNRGANLSFVAFRAKELDSDKVGRALASAGAVDVEDGLLAIGIEERSDDLFLARTEIRSIQLLGFGALLE